MATSFSRNRPNLPMCCFPQPERTSQPQSPCHKWQTCSCFRTGRHCIWSDLQKIAETLPDLIVVAPGKIGCQGGWCWCGSWPAPGDAREQLTVVRKDLGKFPFNEFLPPHGLRYGCRRGCCQAEVRNSKDRMWLATSSTFNFDNLRSDPAKQSGAQCIVRVPVSDVTEIGRMPRYRTTAGAVLLRKRSTTDHRDFLVSVLDRNRRNTDITSHGHAQLLTFTYFR